MCYLKPNDSEKEMLISDIGLETFNIDTLLCFEASCSPNKFVEQEYLYLFYESQFIVLLALKV